MPHVPPYAATGPLSAITRVFPPRGPRLKSIGTGGEPTEKIFGPFKAGDIVRVVATEDYIFNVGSDKASASTSSRSRGCPVAGNLPDNFEVTDEDTIYVGIIPGENVTNTAYAVAYRSGRVNCEKV